MRILDAAIRSSLDRRRRPTLRFGDPGNGQTGRTRAELSQRSGCGVPVRSRGVDPRAGVPRKELHADDIQPAFLQRVGTANHQTGQPNRAARDDCTNWMRGSARPARAACLAVSFDGFQRYFAEGQGQLWERQALCRARPIYGGAAARTAALELVHHILVQSALESRSSRGRSMPCAAAWKRTLHRAT